MGLNIGILGCGWLGLPLGFNLKARGHTVLGTTTQTGRLPVLKNAGIQAHLLEVTVAGLLGDMSFFRGLDVIVLTLPPGSRKGQAADFATKIKHCCVAIAQYHIPKTVFISSTSVYGKQPGTLDENSPAKPLTEAAVQLVASEKHIQKSGKNNCIIRFGGFIGAGRHPVRYLSGKTTAYPNSPVNLIHQKDAVNLTVTVIENPILKGVYNGVAPNHPTREAYYTTMAKQLNLAPPKFRQEEGPESIVSGVKIVNESGFNYQIETLLLSSE